MIITDKKSVIMRAKNCKSSFLEKTVIQVLVNKKRSHPYSPKTRISVSVKHLNDVQILAQSINIILPIPKVTCRHQNISKLSPWFTVDVITALSIIPIRIISIKSFQNLQLPPHLHACAKSTWCFYFTLNDRFVSKCIKFKILSPTNTRMYLSKLTFWVFWMQVWWNQILRMNILRLLRLSKQKVFENKMKTN